MAQDLPAGDFGTWLDGIRSVLEGQGESDVPCGSCTACCRASQFVHIAPDEADALASIPSELLFPAPGLPSGHVVLGYDERGHCPMLTDAGCSIYATRPRTCRAYDCRIFTATGIVPEEPDKVDIAAQAARWRFSVASQADRARWDALRARAAAVDREGAAAGIPTTGRALAALRQLRD